MASFPSPLGPIPARIRAQSAPAAAVAAIAGTQHGIVARRQLLEVGVRATTIARWTDAGHLHRLHRGVYAVGHRRLTPEGRWLAAVVAGGAAAALAGVSGCQLLGLVRRRRIDPIHVCVPNRAKRSPEGVIVHRPRSLEPRDLTRHRGIPVTTATRTIFDVASSLGPKELRVAFEQAEYLELIDRPRLIALLDGARGRRGLGELRALAGAVAIPLSETRSGLERLVLSICRTHDLPIPGINVPLLGYEVDFHWPEARFVVEADGGHHVGGRRDRDNARDIALARAGHLVRRYGAGALRDERAIAAEILEILHERLPGATPGTISSRMRA
ncbi:MAG: DUF559 domain-containing protein [Thermoleophilia bacterium]|nr:DUF559 domain-containing protein [Thermoleophilia bacterium]GIK78557.1 MAG: hypothetical protein BroJett022_22470 [Actinomycetes bacterium]